ncbi:integral membrane protein [Talaromyces proteolyticus]|uniref:Integral membrane protein n=1 Tax=Talaromyces proteolyticus TaxID=1131652 RepID=A0AAD4PTK1_9EURO|nr:uncharacterized protein BGW36DRAFT_401230 [Talaromyces proteolyticus]KAH8690906.1 integral membrane protein [Talaromyces proteolyticus]
MRTLSIVILSLLTTGLVFALIEIGLVGYGIHVLTGSYEVPVYCDSFSYDVCYESVKGKSPDVTSLLMFCAVWTTLVSGAALGYPLYLHQNNGHHHNSWLAPTLIIVYFLTWVFWLAGFADLAYLIGTYGTPIMNAVLAFAVLSWILFMALFIFSFLAIFDVMEGEWPGYLVLKSRSSTAAPTIAPAEATTAPVDTGVAGEPKYETGHELTA